MINSSHLNKLLYFTLFFITLILNTTITVAAIDIWEKKENENEQENQINFEENTIIKSPILSDNTNKISTNIYESEIDKSEQTMLGLFDPEVNNFNLNMWSDSDGEDIKNILKRINKLKLARLSEDLLFQVLFTNSYPPKTNLTSAGFIKIKIDWLIQKKDLKI